MLVGYDFHIEKGCKPGILFCLIGVEVSQINPIPLESINRNIPAVNYLKYIHAFSDGGYARVFEAIYDCLEASDNKPAYALDIQIYDGRFNGPNNPT